MNTIVYTIFISHEAATLRSIGLGTSPEAWRLQQNSFHLETRFPQTLKRGRILNGLAARVKLVPFPKPPRLVNVELLLM
jgi:hypothetical protein